MAKKSAYPDEFGTTALPRLSEKPVRKKPKIEVKKPMYCTEGTGPKGVLYGMVGDKGKK